MRCGRRAGVTWDAAGSWSTATSQALTATWMPSSAANKIGLHLQRHGEVG